MKTKRLARISVIGVVLCAASAGAEVIAGWDFSQFKVPGSLTGGASPLPANYAHDDPKGAGSAANAIGSATLSGLLPTSGEGMSVRGPVRSNRSEPFSFGKASFGANALLLAEGQQYAHEYGLIAPSGDATAVFQVNSPSPRSNWQLSFGGKMASGTGANGGQGGCDPGCTAAVQAEFSTDGVNYAPAVNDALTLDDRRISLDLQPGAGTTTTTAFVRLTLNGSPGRRPVIDNVAVESLPEAGVAAQLLAGVAMLIGLHRRRSR